MRLQRVRITNYRCFDNFDLPVDGESLTLVAANAGGKSSLLTALAAALTGARVIERGDLRDRAEPLEIIATLTDLDPDDQAAFADAVRFGAGAPSLEIGARAIWDDDAQLLDVTWGYPTLGWTRVSRDAGERIRVLWLSAVRDPARLLAFVGQRSLLARVLELANLDGPLDDAVIAVEAAVSRLSLAQEMRDLLSAFTSGLASLIPEVSSSAFGIEAAASTRQELLRQFDLAVAHAAEPVKLARQSSGLAQLAIFSVALELLRAEPTIVLVDEPEISLHPQAQRSLARVIRTSSTQVLFATHSSNVLSGEDLRNVVRLKRSASDGVASACRARGLSQEDSAKLSRYATPETAEAVFARTVIFVEGPSDYLALRESARVLSVDLDARGVAIVSLEGAGLLENYLSFLGPPGLDLRLRGLCDLDAEVDWQQKLTNSGIPVADRTRLNASGFFVCERDLEAELVKAHGDPAVQGVIASDGEAAKFAKFCQQAAYTGLSLSEQLAAFARKRKTVWSPRLASELVPGNVPTPLREVLANV
jgi:hypothetical protein